MGCLNTEPSRETVRGRSMASVDLYDRRSNSVDAGRDVNSWCCWRGDDGKGEEGEKGEEDEEGGCSDLVKVSRWPCISGRMGL